ncbi:TRAP transporter small permease [Albirhodobacter sp. R86504]|uniref:TRAP transporter small permease n=1 Tax=Albirhodobacter sp. R86504 TaxID=3093848 RepID=UPI003670B98F
MKPADLSVNDVPRAAQRSGGRLSARGALAVLGGVMLMSMMGLTIVDVIGRYIFNSPLSGATELTELLLAATIFLGLPAVSLSDDHVTVDLITDKLPQALQPVRRIISGLFAGGILLVVAWRIWVYAGQIGGYGGATTNLMIPIAPLGYFCALCTVAGALISALLPLSGLWQRPKGD